MAKWRVSVSWEAEVEADDEGGALLQADRSFDLIGEATVEALDMCENCEEETWTRETDDMVKLCDTCFDECAKGTEGI